MSEVELTLLTIVALVALMSVSMTKVADSPRVRLPTVQILLANLPPLTLTTAKPLGITSFTTTFTAVSGPLLVTVIVQFTTSPL